jgi:hypothetical protein
MTLDTAVSYMANRWPHHFAHDLDDIVAHGCTTIVHSLSENDALFLQGSMGSLFAMTREAGLRCWANPWGVLGLFGGEAFSAFVPRHPDDCQVLSTGQRAPAACPSSPAARAWLRRWIDLAVALGADTLFWDEPHLYIPDWDDLQFAPDDAWACCCPRCRAAYETATGETMPDRLTPGLIAFRQDLLLDFLGEMTAYAREKGARNALCVLPIPDDHRNALPFDRAAALPGLDIFGTDPYWRIFDRDPAEFVAEQTDRVVAACAGAGVAPQIWVQAFGLPSGHEAEVVVALETAVARGATHIAAWSYRASEVYGGSERPLVVWDAIGRTYRRLRDSQEAP